MTLKKGEKLVSATTDTTQIPEDAKGLKKVKIPAAGVLLDKK
jgi:hypothetical protein